MRILIFGTKGMLGQELVKVFSDEDVVGLDYENLDITDEKKVFEKVKEVAPEVVINAVAYNAVDQAETDEGKKIAFAVNVEAVKSIAKAVAEAGIKLVHYSTDYVFDGEKEFGYAEDDLVNPHGVYAESKALGEKNVRDILQKFYIIRLSRLFGNAGTGNNVKKSFVDVILKAAREKSELEAVDEEISSPTYAPDLAVTTKKILVDKLSYGIYHGANSGQCTWYGLAEEILKEKNVGCKLIAVPASRFPRPAKRPNFSVLLNTKLPKARDYKEALREYLTIID